MFASESGEVGNPGTLGMTKGRVVLPFRFGAADDEQQVPPLRYAPVGMTRLFGTFSVSAGSRTLYQSTASIVLISGFRASSD